MTATRELIEALEFYATPRSWGRDGPNEPGPDGMGRPAISMDSPVAFDVGQRARDALRGMIA